jgi:hypothetical protein
LVSQFRSSCALRGTPLFWDNQWKKLKSVSEYFLILTALTKNCPNAKLLL